MKNILIMLMFLPSYTDSIDISLTCPDDFYYCKFEKYYNEGLTVRELRRGLEAAREWEKQNGRKEFKHL